MVIVFHSKPSILATAAVVGPLEKRSVFASYIDRISDDERFEKKSNERGQHQLINETVDALLKKRNVRPLDIEYFLAGDLVNQMTPTNFAAKTLAASFIGLFSACATSVSAVIVAALLTELGASKLAIAGASSHHNATERQFRYPVNYGAQKPGYAQWTVTGAGFCLIGPQQPEENHPIIVAATVGKVVDYAQTDPFFMGAAMAPAACDTLIQHLEQRQQTLQSYDVIFTGDLGIYGLKILKALLLEKGMQAEHLECLRDAGKEFYGDDQAFQAGASGAGCSAVVFFNYVMEQMRSGRFKRVLLIATGALLSPLSFQQGETIPCTAHAVEVVME